MTVIELGDYHSPATRAIEATVRVLSDETQSGFVRLFWKDADRGFGDEYQLPARLARAAGEQGLFWAMHDQLIQGDADIESRQAARLAKTLELDEDEFERALNSQGLADAVERDGERAGQLPVLATPAFVVDGRPVDGGSVADTSLMAAIDEETKAARPAGDGTGASDGTRLIAAGPVPPGTHTSLPSLAKAALASARGGKP